MELKSQKRSDISFATRIYKIEHSVMHLRDKIREGLNVSSPSRKRTKAHKDIVEESLKLSNRFGMLQQG